jgi:iron complex outermembrane receptor protein
LSRSKSLLLASSILVMTTATPIAAVQAAPVAAANEEVVVTAQKRDENIQSVPLSIVAVTGRTLAAHGITNVVDLQRIVPDLRLDTVAQAAGVALRIRGIGSYSNAATDPSVAPYIDGVFVPRPGAILTSFLDINDVEVLRGPQGTLFGRNATVGAIALRSNAPSTHGDSGSLAGELGDYGRRKVEAIANWAVNDSFALRGAAFDAHTDGWLKNTFDGKTYGRADTFAGRLSAKLAITPAVTWIGRGDYAKTTGDGIAPNQVDVATATAGQLAAFQARSTEPASSLTGPGFTVNQRFDHPSLNDHQVGVTSDLTWDINAGYSLRLIDSYRSWRNNQTDGDVTFTTLDLVNRHGGFASDSQSHELQLLSPKGMMDGRLDYVAGLYYFSETYNTTEVFDLGTQACGFVYGAHPGLIPACQAAPQTNATNGAFGQHAQSVAAYTQANYKIIPTLTLTLGARYTQDYKTGSFLEVVNNPYFGAGVLRAPETTTLSTSDNHPNWRANLSWQITPQVLAFANYSTGYKSGGFNNSGGAAPLTSTARTFASETSTDIELGVKSTFFSRRLLVNADVFQTDLDNFQDRSFNGLTFLVRNAGNVRARGAELDTVIQPIDHIKIDLGAAYLDSIYTSNTAAPGLPACTGAVGSCPTVQNLTGRPTQFAPKWQADLGLEYDTGDFANGWTGQVRGTLNYSSKVFTTNDDNPQSITGGNTLLGARVSVTSPDKSWNFALYGENLTDLKYFTLKFPQTLDSAFGVRVPSTGATLMRGYMGAPLTFGARIAKTF